MAITRHQYRIYIKATIEQVWNALLDPAFTRRYFHGTAFDQPPVVGQPYRMVEDGTPAMEGIIEQLEAPHRLVQTWHFLDDGPMAAEPPSRVEWTLAVAGEGLTRLDVVHGDLARSPVTWAFAGEGWPWILDALKTVVETGEDLPEVSTLPRPGEIAASSDAAGDWHRAQGIECNNSIWELIGNDERSPVDDEELLRRAYSSAYHWQRARGAGPQNEARARYMLAKVHLLTGQGARSLHYADACLAQCVQHGLVDFDLAYAHEARARALRALGREDEGLAAWATAKQVPVVDPEDRDIVEADFADAPET
ncbi:MAG TPA: SRPBCC family protein [Ilumatobacteraceae bacterium]|nr:SRPBCC family protein [Ilumatobacteraceae bacterium]HRB04326.1 SRPBCC family protein [Ilumatobacteraceae bacterium]